MLDVYCRIKNINEESVIFLYGGQKIDKNKYGITLDKLENKQSKSDRKILILVSFTEKSICCLFSSYLEKEGIDKNNVILRYENLLVDPNQSINQFITKQNNIDLSRIFRKNTDNEDKDNYEENYSDLIEIKLDVIDIHEVSKIISFSHKNEHYKKIAAYLKILEKYLMILY